MDVSWEDAMNTVDSQDETRSIFPQSTFVTGQGIDQRTEISGGISIGSRKSLLTLIFAVLSLTFFILLIFFRVPFGLFPLMSYQDALDILTPLVMIPVYWLLFKSTARACYAYLGQRW